MGDAEYHQQNGRQLDDDMRHDQLAGEGIFALGAPVWPYPMEERPTRQVIWDLTERCEAQQRARAILLRDLTEEQKDALLICSMDSNVLDELIRDLWTQYHRGVREGAPKIEGIR
ncbi:hypothetical protein ACFW93_41320 [Streptomyces canus]|uniref:hypothetical protein n=1 Tax=Streptomyces canus TaxID=58343 RepID=UPI0036C6601D